MSFKHAIIASVMAYLHTVFKLIKLIKKNVVTQHADFTGEAIEKSITKK